MSIPLAFAETPKWGAHLDFEGRWGNARSLGDAGLFAPLWQSSDTLFFTDIRGRFDSQDGREGNFGLGIRHMLNSGWNLGAYGYYDARRTSLGSTFNQMTLGAEALSADWDLRANLYTPFGNTSRQVSTTGGGNPFAELANGTIQVVTPGINQIVERAMTGFDGEIGWRAPVFDIEALTQVRVYGGGFYFDGGGVTKDIAGPRGRIEFSIDDLAGFTAARLTLGAEIQHDDVRGTQGFAIARLRVPLQIDRPAARLSAQERRMTERVVRDVDIVSGTGRGAQLRAELREGAVNTWNNQTVTTAAQVSPADQAALQAALNAHGAGSVMILNGAVTGATGTTSVNANQTLISGGTGLAVRGVMTGTTVTFAAPGAAGSINGVASEGLVRVNVGSVVGGLNLANTGVIGDEHGIYGVNANGAVAFSNIITTSGDTGVGVFFVDSSKNQAVDNQIVREGSGGSGVQFAGTSGGRVVGNRVMAMGSEGAGITVNNSVDAYVSGNTISTSGVDSLGMLIFVTQNSVIDRNRITTTGANAHALQFAFAQDNVVKNNTFGIVGGAVIATAFQSSFLGSTGNTLIGPANRRCEQDMLAPSSGTVAFTEGINCVFP